MERSIDGGIENSLIPTISNSRQRLLFYYKWKNRLEPVCKRLECIATLCLHLIFGGSAGILIFHSLVCTFYNQDFRHFCGSRETDITVSISGGVFGMIGAYYLQKMQVYQRCSCLCISDPYNGLWFFNWLFELDCMLSFLTIPCWNKRQGQQHSFDLFRIDRDSSVFTSFPSYD